MARVNTVVNECDVCGHQWIPETNGEPMQCPSRRCRSSMWNRGVSNEDVRIVKLAKDIIEICRNPYGDQVQAIAGDEPLTVGHKIAMAVERMARDERKA